jgi:hypothetical protein
MMLPIKHIYFVLGFLHQGEMIKDITVLHDIGDLHQGI